MLEVLKIRNWEVRVGPSIKIKREIVEGLEKFINKVFLPVARKNAMKKPYWSIKHTKGVSPIIRADITFPDENFVDVKKIIYEIEVRPGGLGILTCLLKREGEKQRIEELKKTFNNCQAIINYESSIKDDEIFAKDVDIPYFENEIPAVSPPWWFRSDRRNGELAKFEEKSLGPIQFDGDKSWMVELQMAKMLESPEQLDWNNDWVIKPLIGSRGDSIEIYLTPSSRKKYGEKGVSSKNRILKRISEPRKFIIQPFICPEKWKIGETNMYRILRPYFVWDYDKEEYRFVAGLATSRANLKVHGASDAVIQLIL